MKRLESREFVRSLRRAAGAGQVLTLPPAPRCCKCGVACCCCWVPGFQNAGPCTCGRACDHEFWDHELSLWDVECLHRLRGMALPEVVIVCPGPFMSPEARRALVEATDTCGLCGDELVDGIDLFNGLWAECANAESEPGAGHFALLFDTI